MYTLNRSQHESAAARAWDKETAAFLLSAVPAAHIAALEATPEALAQLSAEARRRGEAFRVSAATQQMPSQEPPGWRGFRFGLTREAFKRAARHTHSGRKNALHG